MKALTSLETAEARRLVGVLFDLDDTFLDDGRLSEAAYGALGRLRRAGLRLVPVTGRPAGFGEVMVRQWPVDAVMTENGAVALYRDKHQTRRWHGADEITRAARRKRIAEGWEALSASFSWARLSDDTYARESDLAIDIGESQTIERARVDELAREARALGFRTFVSSVHLHITLDPFDKASGTVAFLGHHWKEDPTSARYRYAYIGDSSNDAPCFFAFSSTFGVANVVKSVPLLSVPPRYVAKSEKGAGFVEIADRILTLRG